MNQIFIEVNQLQKLDQHVIYIGPLPCCVIFSEKKTKSNHGNFMIANYMFSIVDKLLKKKLAIGNVLVFFFFLREGLQVTMLSRSVYP